MKRAILNASGGVYENSYFEGKTIKMNSKTLFKDCTFANCNFAKRGYKQRVFRGCIFL